MTKSDNEENTLLEDIANPHRFVIKLPFYRKPFFLILPMIAAGVLAIVGVIVLFETFIYDYLNGYFSIGYWILSGIFIIAYFVVRAKIAFKDSDFMDIYNDEEERKEFISNFAENNKKGKYYPILEKIENANNFIKKRSKYSLLIFSAVLILIPWVFLPEIAILSGIKMPFFKVPSVITIYSSLLLISSFAFFIIGRQNVFIRNLENCRDMLNWIYEENIFEIQENFVELIYTNKWSFESLKNLEELLKKWNQSYNCAHYDEDKLNYVLYGFSKILFDVEKKRDWIDIFNRLELRVRAFQIKGNGIENPISIERILEYIKMNELILNKTITLEENKIQTTLQRSELWVSVVALVLSIVGIGLSIPAFFI